MYNSKLISILRKIPAKSIGKLGDFIRSPYFNKNANIVALFDILVPHAPTFEAPEIERRALHKMLFPNKSYNEQKLRYAVTDLTKLVEQFLIQHKLNDSKDLRDLFLLQQFRELGLDNYFKSTLKAHKKEASKRLTRDGDTYLYEFLLAREHFDLMFLEGAKEKDILLIEMLDSVDQFFIATKLKFYCEVYNNKLMRASEVQPLLMPEIMLHLKDHPYEDIPAIRMYKLVLDMLQNTGDDSKFLALKAALTEYGKYFKIEELQNLYVYARNFCAQKINSGNKDYFRLLFDLYLELVDRRMVFDTGHISSREYRNVVYVGLRLNEAEYVKDFIYKYKDQLNPDERASAFNYNLAYYYFVQGKYDKVHELLAKVESEDTYGYLDNRLLLLRTYYEVEEIVPLFSLIDSLKMYLRRNRKLSDFNKTVYVNFIKFVTKMVKIKLGGKQKLEPLKAEIESSQYIADRFWLEQKLQELEKKRR